MTQEINEIFSKYKKVGYYREDEMKEFLVKWYEQRIQEQEVENVDRVDATKRLKKSGFYEEITGWRMGKTITLSNCIIENGVQKRFDYNFYLLKDRVKKSKEESKIYEEIETKMEPLEEDETVDEKKSWSEFTEEEKEEYRKQKEAEKLEIYEGFENYVEQKTLKEIVEELSNYEFQVSNYSVRNYLLVLSQARKRQNEDFVGIINSYINWKNEGVQVLRNPDKSKPYSYKILMPIFKKEGVTTDIEGGEKSLKGFKLGSVFDISQTNKYEKYLDEKGETEGKMMEKVDIDYDLALEYINNKFPELNIEINSAQDNSYNKEEKSIIINKESSYHLFHELGKHVNSSILKLTEDLDEESTKNEMMAELTCYMLIKKLGAVNNINITYDFGYSNYWGYHILDEFKWSEFENSYKEILNYVNQL
ncbi:MAG: hypothetical protein ACFFAO_03785 [Candidatus Hermodarchaeota archaeon]